MKPHPQEAVLDEKSTLSLEYLIKSLNKRLYSFNIVTGRDFDSLIE